MQTVRNTPYIIAPAAREVELDDAHLHTPQRAPRTVRRGNITNAKVAITAGIALALEALRRTRTADAAGMMMVCENGGCYEAPDPFYQPPAQQAQPAQSLNFRGDQAPLDIFTSLDQDLALLNRGYCPSVCETDRHRITSICDLSTGVGVAYGGVLGALVGAAPGAAAGAAIFGPSARAFCLEAYRRAKTACYMRNCVSRDLGTF